MYKHAYLQHMNFYTSKTERKNWQDSSEYALDILIRSFIPPLGHIYDGNPANYM